MIHIKTDKEIKIMRQAGKILADILNKVISKVEPGVSTYNLNELAEDLIKKAGVKAAFKGFGPQGHEFPAALCTSVNQEVVHGIPSKDKILKRGDIIGIDCGVKFKGYYSDMAKTIPVGKLDLKTEKLLAVTRECLEKGIGAANSGNHLGDISNAIQTHAEKNGFSVVKTLTGHGVGKELHEEPSVFNYGRPETGPRLKNGMVLALEPMINQGTEEVKTKEDGWTIVTMDGSFSAHFEHTILINDSEAEILTRIK
ncbi:MAG TPA: type I methionyl aminopeptidase [Patescibacteria group bacterium]|nr:type I methionyl aminopeptidase [Patescibacteria group bacterium]